MSWYKQDGKDLLLFLKIQPRSSKDAFGEVMEGVRKLRIKAPPVDGKANAYLVKYLAKLFAVPKSRVILESGLTSKNKRIRIKGCTELSAAARLSPSSF
ncbi:MAG TPA: YggU family protein [Thiolapillus brandeum]|uniref:UPF0235 protein ENG92_01350 n=1 Tax=Thiolapillus brandeum TaxID=1076588 RepID=A0A831K2L7_9GAMM|nr:YggU family protein [Thiolapillus brandeum]